MFLLYINPGDSIAASLAITTAISNIRKKEDTIEDQRVTERNTKAANTTVTQKAAPAQSLVTAFLNNLNSNGFFSSTQIVQNIKSVFESLLKADNVILTASQRETLQSASTLLSNLPNNLPNLAGIMAAVFRTPEFTAKLEGNLSAYLRSKKNSDSNNPSSSTNISRTA